MTDANVFKGENSATVSAYLASTELLRNYTERRQVYDRATCVAGEMSSHVRSIAEAEDAKKFRLFLPSSDAMGGMDDGDDPSSPVGSPKGARQNVANKLLQDSMPASEFGEEEDGQEEGQEEEVNLDGVNEGIALKQMTEAEQINYDIEQKQEKLEQLRSFQRAMVEIVDQFEEEREIRVALMNNGQRDASNEEYERMAVCRARRVAEAMRTNFDGLIADNEECEMPEEPPMTFSIQNMSLSLELLGKSIATIMEATDDICVSATFKTEGVPASIGLCVKALRTFTPYAKCCHERIVSHLTHYIRGEQAVLEDGTSEINLLRERFLQCKDRLVIVEQRLRTAEEQREALKKRLHGMHQRCDMWESVLFQRPVVRTIPDLAVEEVQQEASLTAEEEESTEQTQTASPDQPSSPLLYKRRSVIVDKPLDDTYETEVAAFWGNPYVNKAKQYEQACINRAQHRIDNQSPTQKSAFDESTHSTMSEMKKSTHVQDDEAVTTSYARRLALLQTLLRTIPASTFMAMEEDNSPVHSRRKSADDEQLRKDTRVSIQRLIRYTAQHLQSRTKAS